MISLNTTISQAIPWGTRTCEFCGRELDPVIADMKQGPTQIGFYPCNCPESIADIEAANARAFPKKDDGKNRNVRIEQAGIPPRYWSVQTDRRDLVEKAKTLGLYIQGPVGTGKTKLACAIGIELLSKGKSVRFVKAADLVDMLSGYTANLDAIEAIKAPDILIIDDLGMDESRDFNDRRLRRAIDARWDAMKPLIITSNFSKRELTKQMAQNDEANARATISRIFGMTEKVELTGKDRRMA